MIPIIKYKKQGAGYVLVEPAMFYTKIRLDKPIITDYIRLLPDGSFGSTLIPDAGYFWNGCNFFPDIPAVMAPSCYHDAIVQLIKLGLLDGKRWAPVAAYEFANMCKIKGLPEIFAILMEIALDTLGYEYCSHKYPLSPILTA